MYLSGLFRLCTDIYLQSELQGLYDCVKQYLVLKHKSLSSCLGKIYSELVFHSMFWRKLVPPPHLKDCNGICWECSLWQSHRDGGHCDPFRGDRLGQTIHSITHRSVHAVCVSCPLKHITAVTATVTNWGYNACLVLVLNVFYFVLLLAGKQSITVNIKSYEGEVTEPCRGDGLSQSLLYLSPWTESICCPMTPWWITEVLNFFHL